MKQISRRSVPVGIAAFALLLGLVARDSSATTLSGTVTETGVSGFVGTPFVVGDANSTTHAVYGITSRERSDKPCLVAVEKEDVNDITNQTVPGKDLCGPNGTTSSIIRADYANGDISGPDTFVTGIQVCMNSARTRVKGFRLRAVDVSDHGTLIELRKVDTDTYCTGVLVEADGTEYRNCGNRVVLEAFAVRPNCDEPSGWMSFVDCPKGKVATAMVLHFESGNEPRSLTGIGLKCRTVSP